MHEIRSKLPLRAGSSSIGSGPPNFKEVRSVGQRIRTIDQLFLHECRSSGNLQDAAVPDVAKQLYIHVATSLTSDLDQAGTEGAKSDYHLQLCRRTKLQACLGGKCWHPGPSRRA